MHNLETGKRLIAAIVLSTFCVVPLYLALSIVTDGLNNTLLVPVLIMTPVIAFIGVLLVGLPVHFFLVWRRLSRPVHYAVPGFAIPALFVAVVQPFGEDGALWISWQAFLMGVFGAIVALVFRRIAVGKESTMSDDKNFTLSSADIEFLLATSARENSGLGEIATTMSGWEYGESDVITSLLELLNDGKIVVAEDVGGQLIDQDYEKSEIAIRSMYEHTEWWNPQICLTDTGVAWYEVEDFGITRARAEFLMFSEQAHSRAAPRSYLERRDKRVTTALLFFWSTAIVAWTFSWLLPRHFESIQQAIKPVGPTLALIYVVIVVYAIYACVRHVNSYRYKGSHPILLSFVLFAGHIVSTTIYHFVVVLRQ